MKTKIQALEEKRAALEKQIQDLRAAEKAAARKDALRVIERSGLLDLSLELLETKVAAWKLESKGGPQ